MIERRGRRAARATVGRIGLLAAAAAMLAGCVDTPAAPVPGRWAGEGGQITLREDGRGEFEGVPIKVGTECRESSFQPFDGPVEWEESEPGTIQVLAGDTRVTLWADRGGFGGDISWYKIAVGPCGDQTTSAEVITYSRDRTEWDG